MMDSDATSSYPSTMWDEISVYPKVQTGFASKPRMNGVYVESFNNQTFNQDGNESAILKKIIIYLSSYLKLFLWKKN